VANDEQGGLNMACTHLDATGLKCPEPLMLVRAALRDLNSGDLLKVTATDPTTERDLLQLCQYMRHEMVEMKSTGEQWDFCIRKA